MFARIRFDRNAKSMGKCLEHAFSGMVRLISVRMFEVKIHTGSYAERSEKFLKETHIEITHKGLRTRSPEAKKRTAPEIDCALAERFVHWQQEETVAPDAAAFAECLVEGVTECKPEILDTVVVIDVGIALEGDIKIDKGVPSQKFEHVIEESDAGMNGILTGPIEIDR